MPKTSDPERAAAPVVEEVVVTSVRQDLAAIILSPAARANASAAGANLAGLVAHAHQQVVDAKHTLEQILRFHPSTGDDAPNYAALQGVLAKLY